jgi:hypothetical protein
VPEVSEYQSIENIFKKDSELGMNELKKLFLQKGIKNIDPKYSYHTKFSNGKVLEDLNEKLLIK